MKYETPELTALTPAIDAIHGSINKNQQLGPDGPNNESGGAYQDWES